MEKKFITAGALGALVFAGGIAGVVSAQTAAQATGLTEAQIIEIALAEVPGDVQEVEREREKGIVVYEVEILTEDGTEMELEINAETGDILKVKAEHEGCEKDDDRKDT